MSILVGTPSDDTPAILAAGKAGVSALFVSMSGAHPEGRDGDYLAWHALDHRPEQHRLARLRASLRLVSTATCRTARAASSDRYDRVDHVMTYCFTDAAGEQLRSSLGERWQRTGIEPLLAAPFHVCDPHEPTRFLP
jgi:hypothetical protein